MKKTYSGKVSIMLALQLTKGEVFWNSFHTKVVFTQEEMMNS